MSNTIIFLAYAYSEYGDKKGKENKTNRRTSKINNLYQNKIKKLLYYFKENKYSVIMISLLVISTIVYIISLIYLKKIIWIIFSILGYIISTFSLIYLSQKRLQKNYIERQKKYDEKLDGFKEIMKSEFKLDSKEKIEYMIEECKKTSKEFTYNINFVEKFLETWKNYILPIITLALGYILKGSSVNGAISWKVIAIGMVAGVSVIIMIIGVLYTVQKFLEPIIDSYKNKINALERALTDIYLKFYV